jgi:hypothetical protein
MPKYWKYKPKPKASHFGIKFIVCSIILDLLNGEEKKICENFTMVKSTCMLGLISEVTSSTRHWCGRWFCTSCWFWLPCYQFLVHLCFQKKKTLVCFANTLHNHIKRMLMTIRVSKSNCNPLGWAKRKEHLYHQWNLQLARCQSNL